METLSIDIETFSSADLKTSGVYKYTEAPDFTILLLSYSLNDAPVETVDLASGEAIPAHILDMLQDELVLKTAHNAAFERACLAKYLGQPMPAGQWECTMVKSAMLGLPMGLEAVAKVLKLEVQKDANGKALIRYFSVPCKPTVANGQRTRNLPEHAPEKWKQYKDYNNNDVVVELAIRNKISWFEIPAAEKELWTLDQQINDGGIMIDKQLVANAIDIDENYRVRLTDEAIALTGLSNPNSAAQLKKWIGTELGSEVGTLRKGDIAGLMKTADELDDSEAVKQILAIRQEMAKTSIKKYKAMICYMCGDDRARGLFQFCGAGRTWRWAGRGIQMQNLPRILFDEDYDDLEIARNLVHNNEPEELELLFGNVPDTLSQLIRTAFIARPGYRLIVKDFKAIEARVIAWLAGEKWRLDVFAKSIDIYKASASAMFKIPLEDIGKDLRQRGKVAELALGYQGGPNALISMGALDKGLKEEELQPMVNAWRAANPAIVKCWEDINAAAITAVETGEPTGIGHGVSFYVKKGVLFMQLPSGRALSYMRPKLKPGKFGGQALTYEGLIQKTNSWGRMDTYGGKLVENAVQAIARDCLAHAMLNISKAGYKIVAHVHDEIIIEAPDGFGSLEEVRQIMSQPADWGKGIPLDADGFEANYYQK